MRFLLKKITECSRSLSSYCNKTPSLTSSEESHFRMITWVWLKWVSTDDSVTVFLRSSKAFSQASVQSNHLFLSLSCVSEWVILLKFLINCWKKLQKSIKNCIFLRHWEVFQLMITSIFQRFILSSSMKISKFRKVIFMMKNSLFLMSICRPAA